MKLITVVLVFWSLLYTLCAQEDTSRVLSPVSDTIPVLNIFEDAEPLSVTLKYDITSFIRHKSKSEYIDAEMTVSSKAFVHTKDVRLKSRGNFRKNLCFFPPIYLNFKSDPIEGSELKGIRKIKLVTHCQTSSANTNYILREYLAYKLYNVLSDYSFRVQLLDMNYVDTGKKGRHYQKYGFLIEPLELVCSRNEAVEIDSRHANASNIIRDQSDIVAMFHYMVGNTDWRFKGGHNMKCVKSLNDISSKVTPVPYDFDFSGMVGAHYAFPQEWTSIESIKERQYLGYCTSDSSYNKVIDLFLSQKEEMLSVVRNFDYLSEKERQSLINYLEGFFIELENPKRFIERIKYECRDDDF